MDVIGKLEPTDVADHAFVSFQNVQKTYDGETLVVRNLNLDVPRGEFLTLLGPPVRARRRP
jgi:putative spermidine/putrescine transport system ATP-binding protein